MSCRLVSIELESFRGFRDLRHFDLDADIVLVHGDNGSGKTSLTDGILWVLTGELPHINERVKGLRQTHDPLQNRYSNLPSRVALTARGDGGIWRFERSGNTRASDLTVSRDGVVVDSTQALPRAFGEKDLAALHLAVNTWGVLRQDAVRSVLDTGGAALHQRMASVIGLSEVTRFQEACRTLTKRAATIRTQARSERDVARDQLKRAQAALGSLASSGAPGELASDSLIDRLNSSVDLDEQHFAVDVEGIESLDQLVTFGQHVSALQDMASKAADSYDNYVRASDAVTESSIKLAQEIESAEARAADLGRATSAVQRLAETALGMLGDQCPVCDQPIDQQQVRVKLQAYLDRDSHRLLEASEARALADSLRQRLERAKFNESRQVSARAALDTHVADLTSALVDSSRIRLREPQLLHQSLRPLARRLDGLRGSLRRLHGEIVAEASMTHDRLIAAIDAATTELARTEKALQHALRSENTSKLLENQTQAAADRIVARWLGELEPSFAEVFDRLSPHPTFSLLRAKQDVYYRKNQIVPEVVDPLRNVTANPLLIYSEGQLNTVAISYFLGLALNAPTTGLEFMVMDDPLQSMDVLAVLGFADLCRRLRRERQLLITTHDRRYADLLERKLAPREAPDSTIYHAFESWSEVGPRVGTVRREYEATPSVLSRIAAE